MSKRSSRSLLDRGIETVAGLLAEVQDLIAEGWYCGDVALIGTGEGKTKLVSREALFWCPAAMWRSQIVSVLRETRSMEYVVAMGCEISEETLPGLVGKTDARIAIVAYYGQRLTGMEIACAVPCRRKGKKWIFEAPVLADPAKACAGIRGLYDEVGVLGDSEEA